MSLEEYGLQITGAQLRKADELEQKARQALFWRDCQAYDKNYKYIIQNISQLIDIKDIECKVFHEEEEDDTFKELKARALRLKEYRKKKASDPLT